MKGFPAAPLLLVLTFAPPMEGRARDPGEVFSQMTNAARVFLASLDAEQSARARLPFDSDERFNWYFVPRQRAGLPLKQMTPVQQKAAFGLLRAGLSEKGYSKAQAVRALEPVLAALEHDPVGRDQELYYFTIFGDPSDAGTWGWRYEGHHLSQNWTIVQGRTIASSPQFFGSNPAEVRDGPRKGARVLAAEEDLGRALVQALTQAQRKQALLSATAPHEILTSNARRAAIQEDRGIAYSALTKPQQGILLALLDEYAGAQPPAIALQRLDRVRKAGLSAVKFAWMGGTEKGEPHYYRLQGPTFLIEYDCTQNGANHVHSVWRDFQGDFGVDLLAEHYRTSAHHRHAAR